MKRWVEIDHCMEQKFWSRYTEREYTVPQPGAYNKYAMIIETAAGNTLTSLEPYGVKFFDRKPDRGWEDFSYPEVEFLDLDAQTEGSRSYNALVSDPRAYIRYHARKVCKVLFWTNDNPVDTNDSIFLMLFVKSFVLGIPTVYIPHFF